MLLPGQLLQLGQRLTATLAGIPPAGLLQITEGLLAEAAMVPPRPQLKQLMQWVRKIPDLKGRHRPAWIRRASW